MLALVLTLQLAAPAVATSSSATIAASLETETSTLTEEHWYDDWVAIPIVFYVPETSLGFGAMVIRSFDAPGNLGFRRSSVAVRGFYTLKKQFVMKAINQVWMGGDDFSLDGFVEYRIYPFQFFGIGNQPNLETPDRYDDEAFEIQQRFVMRAIDDVRVGARFHLIYGRIDGFAQGGLLDRANVAGLGTNATVGAGPAINWDTRDSNFWPRSGNLISGEATFYTSDLGSDFNFVRLLADARHYRTLWLGHVLAGQARYEATIGETPFTQLALLGGNERHRGWFEGSLRDAQAMLIQLEYRAPIWWRFGAVGFFSMGQALSSLTDLDPRDFRFAGGGGIRFRLNDEGVNIRIDFAYGGRFELYFQVGEAF